ncbi:MAG: glycoside hydrolase [Planctomycetes bacterium]|nr:glycoside hydrolase [Planctomycetota bacterium]
MPPTAPQVIATLDESGRIVRLPDGTLHLYLLGPADPARNRPVLRRVSHDHGATWADAQPVLTLDGSTGGWGCVDALIDDRGDTHLFLLNDRNTGVFARPMGEMDQNKTQLGGVKIDIWHCKTTAPDNDAAPAWTPPVCIWKGYTGSLNSVVQLRSGRIVLPFSHTTDKHWFNRWPDLDNFTFHGQFVCTVLCSDDRGASWSLGTPDIRVPVPDPTGAYGAVEPVVVERRDGSVWMLIRTQMGRFYESFSPDGAEWSIPTATRLLSSDSPAGIVRLIDDRLVMLWNLCLRYPYAYGGRQVIHAAISEDDGKTWRGMRECAADPRRHEPPPNQSGDFGTAYPYPSVTADNRVIYVTGQGRGRVQLLRLDPDWLTQTQATSNFTDGEAWHTFGTAGVSIQPHPDRAGAKALRLTRELPGATAAALWNFLSGRAGTLRLRFRAMPACGPLRVSLMDHFSPPFDTEDALHALFNIRLDGERYTDGKWHELMIEWDTLQRRDAAVYIDEHPLEAVPLLHETMGACYVRLVSEAKGCDAAGYWFDRVEVGVTQ